MAKTFQIDGNPVAVRLQQPGTPSDKRQLIPYHALADYAGREAQIATYGDLLVAEKLPDISIVFNYFINPQRTVQALTGAGVNSINASRLKVAVEGGAGSAEVKSLNPIIYRTGHDAFALFTCAFDNAAVGTTQEAGVWNSDDGFYISLSETGKLQANHLVGGVNTPFNQEDFNLDKLDGSGLSGFTINLQALLIYRITYGYLGQAPAYFEVHAGAEIGWVPFHVIDITNEDNNLILTDPFLPIKFKATSDGTNDVAMFSGSWLGGVIGSQRRRADNDQFAFDVSKALTGGESVIGSMRVKATFQSRVNKIPLEFHLLTAGVEGTKPHVIRMYKNTPLTGSVWIDPLGPTSVAEIDLTGTLTGTSPIELVATFGLGKSDSLGSGVEFPVGEIQLVPEETLTFTIESVGNSDIILAGTWEELK